MPQGDSAGQDGQQVLEAGEEMDAHEHFMENQESSETQPHQQHEALEAQHARQMVECFKARHRLQGPQHGKDGQQVQDQMHLTQEIQTHK